ncbi:MAG: putative porin [Lentisphaerae bacterium]|nr:putative porin [Lentisphaerota bacterium]
MRGYGVIDWSNNFKGYGNTVREITDDQGRVVQAVYADEYHELELMASIGFNCPWTGLPLGFYGNFVRNIEADDDNKGFQTGIRVGGSGRLQPLELDYSYRYLEADAVVGAFSDSVSWGGGTNGKGHKLAAAYRIVEHLVLRASLYLDQQGLGAGEESRDYKRVLVDITASF